MLTNIYLKLLFVEKNIKNYYFCSRFGLTMSTKRRRGPKLNIERKIIHEGHNR